MLLNLQHLQQKKTFTVVFAVQKIGNGLLPSATEVNCDCLLTQSKSNISVKLHIDNTIWIYAYSISPWHIHLANRSGLREKGERKRITKVNSLKKRSKLFLSKHQWENTDHQIHYVPQLQYYLHFHIGSFLSSNNRREMTMMAGKEDKHPDTSYFTIIFYTLY